MIIHRLRRERYVNAPQVRPMQVRREELFGLRRDGSEFPAEITSGPDQDHDRGR